MPNDITVSVIIPLYNEENYIEHCLMSLCQQTFPMDKMEWLLVDGKSTDQTCKLIEKYAKIAPIRLLINENVKTPYALNLGIQNAIGTYVIRIDAHANYASNYIERCVYYLDTMDIENVGGIATTKSSGYVGTAIALMLSSKFGVGNSTFRTERHSGFVDTVPFGAYRKSIFDRVGMFNTTLIRSEDNEMNRRIIKNGGKIYLAADIAFTYYCRNTILAILKMGIQNGNALFPTFRITHGAMRARHFIPFLFFVSLIVFPLLCFWSEFFLCPFIAEMLLYIILDFYFSFLDKKPQYGFLRFILYPAFHFSYGLGSALGLIGIVLY